MARQVVITGATGFIGRVLTGRLLQKGFSVTALTRNESRAGMLLPDSVTIRHWDTKNPKGFADSVDGAFAVVNLAGESIANIHWNDEKKEKILKSRTEAGRAISAAIDLAKTKPSVLIQASAVGFYGSRGEAVLGEDAAPGKGFLSKVCVKWEASTRVVEEMGVRRVVTRSGIVLGNGGALRVMRKQFEHFLGGAAGGEQWFSWIHVQDEVGAMIFLIENESASGIFNLAAPNPVKMEDFAHALGKAMGRPSIFKVPSIIVSAIMGEAAEETILASIRALPRRLMDAGFKFKFPEVKSALADIVSEK